LSKLASQIPGPLTVYQTALRLRILLPLKERLGLLPQYHVRPFKDVLSLLGIRNLSRNRLQDSACGRSRLLHLKMNDRIPTVVRNFVAK
jgi:hypothetical protein